MPTKKVFLYAGTGIFLLASPFIFLSTGMMGCYQRQIDKNPNSESAKNWQFRLGNWCRNTGRPELAAEFYKKFIDRYKQDERRPQAMYLRAESLKDAEKNNEAREQYKEICRTYPKSPFAKEANDKLILYWKDYTR